MLAGLAPKGGDRSAGMLPSVAVRAGELLAAVAIAGLMLLAVAAGGVWWLRRRVRRRLQVLGRVMAGRARQATAGRARTGSRWLLSRPLPDRRWVTAARARRQLWRAVAAAEHAVALAREGGAPVGDLDALCQRLRRAAVDADRSLAIQRHVTLPGAGPQPASSQVSDLVSAAGQIQGGAATALTSVSRPAVSSLADDVSREAVALSAGIASAAASAGPGGLPGKQA
jgi:hypothetical protein